MNTEASRVKVHVLKAHTFRGILRTVGEEYELDGDQAKTAEEYADVLRLTQCARRVETEPAEAGRKRKR